MIRRVLNFIIVWLPATTAWYIAPPKVANEWTGLSKLIVDTFDAPKEDASAVDKAAWFLFKKEATERATYQQYVSTARKMRGTKYSVLLAKEAGKVVGMVEVGINSGDKGEKRPTIGLICVAEGFRQKGVGADLVQRCERLVVDVWKDHKLFAEVEETNEQALQFFESLGFEMLNDKRVMVNLRRGLQLEERPHILLTRTLAPANDPQ